MSAIEGGKVKVNVTLAVLEKLARAFDVSVDDLKKELEEKIISIVAKEFGKSNLPIVANFDVGHTDPQLVLPLGVKAEIDRAMFWFWKNGIRTRKNTPEEKLKSSPHIFSNFQNQRPGILAAGSSGHIRISDHSV
ncbi:MAG: hypothetical protein AAB533_02125 [Patescibacteria group bacterium]